MSKVYIHGPSHGAIKLSLRRSLWPSIYSLPRAKSEERFRVGNESPMCGGAARITLHGPRGTPQRTTLIITPFEAIVNQNRKRTYTTTYGGRVGWRGGGIQQRARVMDIKWTEHSSPVATETTRAARAVSLAPHGSPCATPLCRACRPSPPRRLASAGSGAAGCGWQV